MGDVIDLNSHRGEPQRQKIREILEGADDDAARTAVLAMLYDLADDPRIDKSELLQMVAEFTALLATKIADEVR